MLSRYQSYSNQMGTGDLLLFRGTSPVSWAIRAITGGDVNHAAMILRIDEYLEGRVMQMGAVARGFYPTPLSDALVHYTGKVWWLPLKQDYNPLRREMGRQALLKSGVKYDFKSLFKNALAHVSLDARQFLCSEAYQWIGYRAGLPKLVGYETKAMRPCELEMLGWCEDRIRIL